MIVCLAKEHIIKLHTHDDDFVMQHLPHSALMQLMLVAVARKEMLSESISTLVAIVSMPDDTPWSDLLNVAPRIRKHKYDGLYPVVYVPEILLRT